MNKSRIIGAFFLLLVYCNILYSNHVIRTFTTADGMANDRVNGFCQDASGVIWICNWYGLERFDGYRFQCFRPQKELDANSRMSEAILTPDNHIVVATAHGKMLSFSLNDYTYSMYVGEFPEKGITFTPSFTDDKGNLWEKDSVGIRLVCHSPVNYYFLSDSKYLLPRAFYEDSKHLLWIAWSEHAGRKPTYGEVGIYELDGKRIKTVHRGNAVYCIHEDKWRNMWLGTRNEGLVVLKPNGRGDYIKYCYSHTSTNHSLLHDRIFDIEEDSQGRIWIATLGGGINIVEAGYDVSDLSFGVPKKYPYEMYSYVRSLLEEDGHMLVATDNGLLKTNIGCSTHKMEFRAIKPTNSVLYKPADELIHLAKTKDNRILISSFGEGIYEFDNSIDKFFPLLAGDIAQKQTVYSMLDNQDGRLWITTPSDLLFYDADLRYSSPIHEDISMIETKPLRDSRGQCWFATRKGALCVKEIDEYPLHDKRTKAIFSDVTYHLADTTQRFPLTFADTLLYIRPEARNFTVHVSALRYCNMEKMQYSWRVAEQDTAWKQLNQGNEITIPSIKPGEWTLEVRYADERGRWTNNVGKLRLNVLYRWYETSWVHGILILLVVVGGVLLILFILKFRRIHRMYDSLLNSQPIVMAQTAMTKIKPEDMLTDDDKQFIDDLNSKLEKIVKEKDFSIDALAASMGMSRSVFYRRLKGIMGQSPIEYINEYRMLYATELLRKEPEKSISEIAYECGFSSPQYFSNVFRKRNHTTPNEWRKKHQ